MFGQPTLSVSWLGLILCFFLTPSLWARVCEPCVNKSSSTNTFSEIALRPSTIVVLNSYIVKKLKTFTFGTTTAACILSISGVEAKNNNNSSANSPTAETHLPMPHRQSILLDLHLHMFCWSLIFGFVFNLCWVCVCVCVRFLPTHPFR